MGQKLALIIATAEYQDTGLARLAAPGLDAHDFAGALRSPEIGAFDGVQMLLNESEPVARRAIARFFGTRKPDDLLLLYFSGHGVRDDHGQLYLAVSDTDRSLLSATAIPANFINEQMNASRSRRQVLILDCCNSGAFAQGSKAALGGSMGIATAFEGTGYGRVVLTATDATQYAWEGDEALGEAANSVFTHFLVKGLETGAADADGDGRITLDELYDYVYEQVVTQTPRQTPRKFAYNQQGELVIANNPRPAARPAELPAELRQAVESPLSGVREAAVAELDRLLAGSHRGLALAALEALAVLAQDDSRRVSAAAEAALKAHAAAQEQARLAQARQEAEAAERLLRARAELEVQQRAAEQAAAEKAAEAKAEQARQARLAAEQAAQAERERVARERAEAELRAEQERLAQARLLAEKQAAEEAAAEKAVAEKAEQERLARVKAAAEEAAQKLADAQAEQQRLERERAEAARLAVNKAAEEQEEREAQAQREAAAKAAAERARQETEQRLSRERIEQEQLAEQQAAKAEREKVEAAARVAAKPVAVAPVPADRTEPGLRRAVTPTPPLEAKPAPPPATAPPPAQGEEAAWRLARPPAEPGPRAVVGAMIAVIEANWLPASANGALTRAWDRLPAWPTLAPWVLTAVVAVAWGYAARLGDAVYYQVVDNVDFSAESAVGGAASVFVAFALSGAVLVGLLALLRRELRGGRALAVWGAWCLAAAAGQTLKLLLTEALDWSIGGVVSALLIGGLPGLALAWGLLGAPGAGKRLAVALIALGWTAAFLISTYLYNNLSWSVFWHGVPLGAVGAGVTFWQLRDWLDVTKPLPVTAARAPTPKPARPSAALPASATAQNAATPGAPAAELTRSEFELNHKAWAVLGPLVSSVLIALGWWFVVPFSWQAFDLVHKAGLRDDLAEPFARGTQWVVQYTLAAVVISVGLALVRPSLRGGRAVLIPLAWFFTSAAGWGLGWGLNQNIDWFQSQVISCLVTGGLGGWVVARLALNKSRPGAWARTLIIMAGWAAAVAMTLYVHELLSATDDPRLTALLGGAVGAVVTFGALWGRASSRR